jgi:hypothetical protein
MKAGVLNSGSWTPSSDRAAAQLAARPPNITFDRTAGSHSLAAAGQRERSAADDMRVKETPSS